MRDKATDPSRAGRTAPVTGYVMSHALHMGTIDRQVFGKCLRAARILSDCGSVREAADEISHLIHMSERTLYLLERGEQDITVAQWGAVLATYKPPGGDLFFLAAMSADLRKIWFTPSGVYSWHPHDVAD